MAYFVYEGPNGSPILKAQPGDVLTADEVMAWAAVHNVYRLDAILEALAEIKTTMAQTRR